MPARTNSRIHPTRGALLALFLILGCNAESPTAPGGGQVPNSGIAGLVQAPPAMRQNGGSWDNVRGPLNEAPLAGVEVKLLGLKGEELQVPAAVTDQQGIFRFDSIPVEAGLVRVMPPAVEATKPLLAYFHLGQASYVGVASTLVAGALQKALRDKPDLTYAAFDPQKVASLQAAVDKKANDSMTVMSLYFLDQILVSWARADQVLKTPLESVAPGVTALPAPEPTPKPFGKK